MASKGRSHRWTLACLIMLVGALCMVAPAGAAPAQPPAPAAQPSAVLPAAFAAAAREFGVPERVLLVVSYNLSRWDTHGGAASAVGGYGPMHLTHVDRLPDFSAKGDGVTSLGLPLPGVVAPLVATLEVAGGLLLILGLATRWVSLLFALEMLVTTLLVKLPNLGLIAPQGKPGVGAELDLLLLVAALVLLTHGPGPLSVERNLLKREL